MSIITQALKKAQREQSLHQGSSIAPRAATSLLVRPRTGRPWPRIALVVMICLGTGVYTYYMRLMPQPAVSRAMLAPTSPPSPLILSTSDEQPRPSQTALPPHVAFKPPVAAPTQPADSPILNATLESMPSPVPTIPSVSPLKAVVAPSPPTPTVSTTGQASRDAPDQHHAKRRFNEALEALASDDRPQAEQLLLQTIALNPDMKAAYTTLGNLYYQRQDYARAIAMYQHALSVDPTDVKARNNLGSSYMQLAMHDEAIAELRKAIDMDNTSGLAYYNLACAYARTGAKILAVEYLQQAIERVPQARDWALTDGDFASVKSAPAFQKLLGLSS